MLTRRKEEGGTTIGSATSGGITTILVLKSKPKYSINEPLQGGVPFGGL
jgi:hypothetical protein